MAEDYAHRHNVPKWYDNADDLINDPEVDAVYIATTPSSHKDYTLAVAGGGYFYDLASHQIDLLQFYLGDIIDAKGFNVNQLNLYKAEDSVTASLHFPNNIIGSGIWSFNSYKEVDRTEIMGTIGSILFSTFNNEPITIETNEGIEKISIDNPPHVQLPLIQKIVNELLENDKSPGNGYTGAQTNKVIDWIYAK